MVNKILGASLLFLLFTAVLGCIMRFYSAGISTGLVFGNVLHAHSHTAMMGWVYIAMSTLFYLHFISQRGFKGLFVFTLLAVLGLMVSFILQGYGAVSIFFCVLHLFCTYLFTWKVLRELKGQDSQAVQLLRIALYMLMGSTLGLWGIAPAMALSEDFPGLFSTSIQFYLHFQFNGFFYFGIVALFFSSQGITLSARRFSLFVAFSVWSTVLSFAVPLSWYFSGEHLYLMQLLGAGLQVLALVALLGRLRYNLDVSWPTKTLFYFAAASFFLKNTLPLFFVHADFIRLSHEIRSITIGYIHLLMLGMISGFLVFCMVKDRVLDGEAKSFKWGVALFLLSFCLTEALLLLQSVQVILQWSGWKHQYTALAVSSLPFPLAVVCWLGSLKK